MYKYQHFANLPLSCRGNKGDDRDRKISQTGSRQDSQYDERDDPNSRDFVMERERDREREMGERGKARNGVSCFIILS